MRKFNSFSAILLMLFLLPLISLAQGTLSGTVTSNGKPAENISVAVSKGGGTITGSDGKYSLKIAAGTFNVTFSNVGYVAQTIKVTITDGEQKVLNISLVESNQNLDDIIVVGTRSVPRSAVGTPLPVDNVDQATLKSTGQTTFDKALQYRVPSFNTSAKIFRFTRLY